MLQYRKRKRMLIAMPSTCAMLARPVPAPRHRPRPSREARPQCAYQGSSCSSP